MSTPTTQSTAEGGAPARPTRSHTSAKVLYHLVRREAARQIRERGEFHGVTWSDAHLADEMKRSPRTVRAAAITAEEEGLLVRSWPGPSTRMLSLPADDLRVVAREVMADA